MKKQVSVRKCEVVSRLRDDKGNVLFDIENLQKILDDKSNCISHYAYIVHDKDTYSEDNEKNKKGDLKPSHIHLLIKFKNNQPQHISAVSSWFKIPEQFVSKIFGKWQDGLLYLTHENAPEKYQYPVENVVSNFDFKTAILNAKSKNNIDSILQRILEGEIREYNKTVEIDNLLLVNQSKKIEQAFKIRAEHLQATCKERNVEVIYICGKSGSGKTTLAKKIAKERGLDYFISSGSNDVMDGYAMQPALILDDIRPSCLGLSDLLKLLDNHTASSIKSRYKNKYLNCELVILTSVLEIEDFYHNVFENEKEPINQLKRRCGTYIRMTETHISIQVWDNILMRYSCPVYYMNDLLLQYREKEIVEAKTPKEIVEDLLPFLNGKEIETETPKTPKHIKNNSNPKIISDSNFIKLFKEEI